MRDKAMNLDVMIGGEKSDRDEVIQGENQKSRKLEKGPLDHQTRMAGDVVHEPGENNNELETKRGHI